MKLSQEEEEAMMCIGAKPTWEQRELPTDRWTPPKWLIGCHVHLHEGCANTPTVVLKTNGSPWPVDEPVIYDLEGEGAWVARSSDGYVMLRHHHSGARHKMVSWRIVHGDRVVTQTNPGGWMYTDASGGLTQASCAARAAQAYLLNCRSSSVKDGFVVEFRDVCWVTEAQNGYGGRAFEIETKSLGTVVLRGPWHGSSPVGWQACTLFDIGQWNERMPRCNGKRGTKMQPWYRRGGTFGYFFANDLVLHAVARWQPHLGVAMVYPGYGHARYEFYDQAWGAPKGFAEERRPGWGVKA